MVPMNVHSVSTNTLKPQQCPSFRVRAGQGGVTTGQCSDPRAKALNLVPTVRQRASHGSPRSIDVPTGVQTYAAAFRASDSGQTADLVGCGFGTPSNCPCALPGDQLRTSSIRGDKICSR